jgi:intermediate peptidase
MANTDHIIPRFGHALHSILSTTRFQNLAGTRTALDFVEMPSHLFEYFARDQRVLQHISKGFGNKTIPQSLVEDMLRNSQLFSGIDAQTQIFYSLLDLELHSSPNVGNGGSVEILKTVQNEYTPFRYVEGTAWHTRFGHLYG